VSASNMPGLFQSAEPLIFINYRRTDAGWPADHIADKLTTTFGRARVFLDDRGIDAGDDFAAELESTLRRATAFIVLIGENWLRTYDKYGRRRLDQTQDWVRREIRVALEKEDCKVIPVFVDEAVLPDDKEALPEDISALLTRQWMRVRQANSEQDIEALSNEIEKGGFRRVDRVDDGPSGAREFTDTEVNDVVRRLRELQERRGTEFLTARELLPELDLLFNRKTFRFEALRGCPEQRWADRLDSAYQTLRVLHRYMRSVRETAPSKYPVYRDLVMEVDRYCMQMGALLFDPPVDYNAIEEHIGKPTFKDHLPVAIPFPKGPDKQPVISDTINDKIEPHRLRAVELMDQLLERPPVRRRRTAKKKER
jgi:TIR domain-containing protein